MYDGRVSASEDRIPDSIQKEMDKRKIGESITSIANSLRRHNSWENSRSSSGNSQKNRTKGLSDTAEHVPKKRGESPNRFVE